MKHTRRAFIATACATGMALRIRPSFASVTPADRIGWQRQAKFGMFIHWGPYSLAGVEASWPIMTGSSEITEDEYRKLPSRFNPVEFNAHEWIELAQRAGQRYMVFTAKHHDGFCMFDSNYTNYKITKTPYGKDITRQLADACKEHGMALGLYYSPPDMNHPAYRDISKPATSNYRGEPARPEWPLYLDYMELQLNELLTKYGPLAEIWFDSVDMRTQLQYDGQRFLDQVRLRQPGALVNNRLGVPADFVTPEQFIPKAIPVRGVRMDSPNHTEADKQDITIPREDQFQPWETCMTINSTWAYRPKDRNFKSADTLIRNMVEIISRGGNFLLDVGPQPDGKIQPEFVERLESVGEWVHANADSIYGSTYGPIQGEPAYRTTSRASSTYVFVMDSSATSLEVKGIKKRIASMRHLGSGQSIRFQQIEDKIRLSISQNLWSSGLPVFELRS